MIDPIIYTEWLREGRSLRLTMILIFYDSILAFITLLFMFFNTESFQEGYNYDTSAFLQQFLVVSSLQIFLAMVLIPVLVTSLYSIDRTKHITEQFAIFPEYYRSMTIARASLAVGVNMFLYCSSLPIIFLSCIYSNVTVWNLVRLGFMIFFVSFWSGATSIFCFNLYEKPTTAFAAMIALNGVFLGGTLMLMEVVRAFSVYMGRGVISQTASNLCLGISLMNPLAVFMGFYGNVSGDTGLVESFAARFGIDSTSSIFSLLYYKGAGFMGFVISLILLIVSVALQENKRKRRNELVTPPLHML